MKIEKITRISFFTAISLILSFVETLIPVPVPVPGIKLGLPNIGVLCAMLLMGFKEGIITGILKSVIASLFFGRSSSLIYSLPATLMSGFAMGFCIFKVNRDKRILSPIGVSVAGSAVFNVSQLAVASKVITDWSIFNLLPYFLILSVITGIFIGVSGGFLTLRLKEENIWKN